MCVKPLRHQSARNLMNSANTHRSHMFRFLEITSYYTPRSLKRPLLAAFTWRHGKQSGFEPTTKGRDAYSCTAVVSSRLG